MPARILLADCDQMFVAVARLVDPDGAGRAPMLVVGGSAKSRGVVCSASYEVRSFGVRAGMPIARAARLCPDAMFVPVPRKAIGEKSREVRHRLIRWAPTVEAASVDEFYLDLTGTEALYHHEPLAATATRIRADLLEQTGLRLSIGGGTNRLIAKLAAERAKPRPATGGTGVLVVVPGGEAEFVASHRLADLPGVGPRMQATLARFGLVSVQDALRVDLRDLASWLGPTTGRWLFDRMRGAGNADVASDHESKSMSHEETFARDLTSDDALEGELLHLVTRLAADLRGARLQGRCVVVKLRDFDFRTRSARRTLPHHVDGDRVIYETARTLLRGLRHRRRVAARLLGVAVTQLRDDRPVLQTELGMTAPTSGEETDRDRALSRAKDRVTERFGDAALQPARLAARQRRARDTRIESDD